MMSHKCCILGQTTPGSIYPIPPSPTLLNLATWYQTYLLFHIHFLSQGLSVIDLEDLLEDIKVYLELEKGRNQDYWRDITTITEDQLAQARRLQPSSFGMMQ